MLELHIDKKHPETGEKRFFCDICDKGKTLPIYDLHGIMFDDLFQTCK